MGAEGFGKYALVARIARGGMAEILLARLANGSLLVLKRILPGFTEDRAFVDLFLGEARLVTMIAHGNVCRVYEVGEIGGSYYLAMEYMDGLPLSAYRKRALVSPEIAVGIGVQACEGLHHAHELLRSDGTLLGVIHRDVSANNLHVTASGVVKVLDFGIAKAQDVTARTATGMLKGTYAYMAPEQLRGQPTDRRVDIWALGTVMWETLAGRSLFARDTEFLTFSAIINEPIPHISDLRPDVPRALGDAIAMALQREPGNRQPTARWFGQAMAAAVAPAPVAAIAADLAQAFPRELADQRALVELARAGGDLPLDRDWEARALDSVRPVSDPRAQPARSVIDERPVRRRGLAIAVALLVVAGGAVAAVIALNKHGKAPVAAAPAPAPAAPDEVPAAPAVATPAAAAVPQPAAKTVAKKQGYVTISSKPIAATVSIDGTEFGPTPLTKVPLPVGEHTIHAVGDDGGTQDFHIYVASEQSSKLGIYWANK